MKKKKRSTVSTLLMLVCLVVMIVSGWQFFSMLQEYLQAVHEYDNLESGYTRPRGDGDDDTKSPPEYDPESEKPPIDVDWAELRKLNPDIVGWIYIGSIDISYPIVQTDNNDYYLHHTTEKTYNFSGSIFMDYLNTKDFSDKNTILYGHNMRNGSMFGKLDHIVPKKLYKEDPYFWILTPRGNYKYEMFSIYESAPTGDTFMILDPNYPDDFLKWVEKMWNKSEVKLTDHVFTPQDSVVTLSTCTSQHTTRTIVQGYPIVNPVKKNRIGLEKYNFE